MVRNTWSWPLIAALALVVALGAASCGGGGNEQLELEREHGQHERPAGDVLAALVSDIGKFNDRSFNQSQLEGLNKAKSELGVKTLAAAVELRSSDYIPNLTSAVRKNADLVISAGFLLADATQQIAKKFPEHALRDHRLLGQRARRSRRTARTSRA